MKIVSYIFLSAKITYKLHVYTRILVEKGKMLEYTYLYCNNSFLFAIVLG